MEMPDVTKIMHEMNENTAAITADRDRLQALNAELVAALEKIEMRAHSDASAEELEDAQRDLRHIHATARAALAKSKGAQS